MATPSFIFEVATTKEDRFGVMERRGKLLEMPEIGGNMLFSLKDVSYPETLRMNEPFIVKGKVGLFGIPFFAPIWVIAKVTFPEKWWEEIIPIWGSPTRGEGKMAIGGEFEINFPRGFDREGEFILKVEVHLGPTYTVDTVTLPPFPPLDSIESTFIVSGEAPPGGFRGEIFKKELEHDETRRSIPADNVSQDTRGLVHIWCRNKTTETQQMGIWWQIKDPDGTVVEEYGPYWDMWPFTSPGGEHEFIGDRFDLSKLGTYTIDVELSMDRENPIVVDEYSGSLCTVTEAAPPPEEADIKNVEFQLVKGTYDIGEKVPFTCPYDYKGIAQSGRLTISIGLGVWPTFSPVYVYNPIPIRFAVSADWQTYPLEGDITLPSVLEPGRTYSVRAVLEALEVPTKETDTDWSAFKMAEALLPKADIRNLEFSIRKGTYELGANIPFTCPYDYKGIAQSGRLTISIGLGVYPTFSPVCTYEPIPVEFEAAAAWRQFPLEGIITLPDILELGRTYSIRARLETLTVKTADTDTDWSAFKTAEVPAPPEEYTLYISAQPPEGGDTIPPVGAIQHSAGSKVTIRAYPRSGYEFAYWSGDASGTSPSTTITMDSDKIVTAVFREIAPPIGISFSVGLYNIPYWLQPVYEWYIIWRGKTYGRWTSASYAITLDNVSATGAMSVVLKHDGSTHRFTTSTYTLEDGRTYRFNVETVTLEGA